MYINEMYVCVCVCVIQKNNYLTYYTSLTGFEPAIFTLGGRRVIHCATGTYKFYSFMRTRKQIYVRMYEKKVSIYAILFSRMYVTIYLFVRKT